MDSTLIILAVVGTAAAVRCLVRAAFRAVRQSAYAIYAREIASARARRGDLTGLEEAREWVVGARRERRRAIGEAGVWVASLALPLYLLAEPAPVYALYMTLWIRPGRSLIRRLQARGSGKG